MIANFRIWIGAAVFGLVVGCSSSSQQPSEDELAMVLANAEDSLVFIEGGEFRLGDVGQASGEPFSPLLENNKPPIMVTIQDFSMQSKEVTWGEFLVFLRDVGRAGNYTIENGFRNAARLPIESNDDPTSPNYALKPARSPNYSEAEEYCAWLAEKTNLPFAIPTEAQWEYAARNRGQRIAYATNTGELLLDDYLQKTSVDPLKPVTGNVLIHSSFAVERRPVGSYQPSPLGLYDMTGNVPEWTRDWFQSGYGHLDASNPVASEPGEGPDNLKKSVRDIAGYGDHSGGLATVYARRAVSVDSPNQGFRCVVNHPEPIN